MMYSTVSSPASLTASSLTVMHPLPSPAGFFAVLADQGYNPTRFVYSARVFPPLRPSQDLDDVVCIRSLQANLALKQHPGPNFKPGDFEIEEWTFPPKSKKNGLTWKQANRVHMVVTVSWLGMFCNRVDREAQGVIPNECECGLAGFPWQFWLCVINNSRRWEHIDHSGRWLFSVSLFEIWTISHPVFCFLAVLKISVLGSIHHFCDSYLTRQIYLLMPGQEQYQTTSQQANNASAAPTQQWPAAAHS